MTKLRLGSVIVTTKNSRTAMYLTDTAKPPCDMAKALPCVYTRRKPHGRQHDGNYRLSCVMPAGHDRPVCRVLTRIHGRIKCTLGTYSAWWVPRFAVCLSPSLQSLCRVPWLGKGLNGQPEAMPGHTRGRHVGPLPCVYTHQSPFGMFAMCIPSGGAWEKF
jgi:hypothetical protein